MLCFNRMAVCNPGPWLTLRNHDLDEEKPQIVFEPIPQTVTHSEDIHTKYRAIEGFIPKDGDWIGLFRCHDVSCTFVSFEWVKNLDLMDSVQSSLVFQTSEIDVSQNLCTL